MEIPEKLRQSLDNNIYRKMGEIDNKKDVKLFLELFDYQTIRLKILSLPLVRVSNFGKQR
ncbi:hypothetical protein [Bergeyella zoohelcum]|uniref:Uncharacterized protein n=1 Tax=Bergeyella zoohelcum TaxID=1015 RepID=A0A7Z8YM02_9FLAO|nr:hypothetical protein [Bergeyella zoohelcum]VDH02854.1 Uncharacterised protein [Bergeyella zoohelcum]